MTVVDIEPQDYFVQQEPQIRVLQPVPQPVALQTEGGLTSQQLMLLAMFFTTVIALVIILYIISRSSERRR